MERKIRMGNENWHSPFAIFICQFNAIRTSLALFGTTFTAAMAMANGTPLKGKTSISISHLNHFRRIQYFQCDYGVCVCAQDGMVEKSWTQNDHQLSAFMTFYRFPYLVVSIWSARRNIGTRDRSQSIAVCNVQCASTRSIQNSIVVGRDVVLAHIGAAHIRRSIFVEVNK